MNLLQPSFAGGELSPDMYGRVDISKYSIGAKLLQNFIVHPHGGVSNRPGTKVVANTKSNGAAILIPFEFNLEQTYVLEFGDEYIRFHSDGGQVVEAAKAITGITNANPAVVTAVAHGYENGDEVFISGVGGMTQVNGRNFIVANKATDTFELQGIDSTNFGTYTTGGSAFRIYEIESPYASADLRSIKYTQSADVMTLVCDGYDAMELSRLGNTNWTLTTITFVPTISRPTGVNVTASAGSGTTYRYRVTAVSRDGAEESLPGLNNTSKNITGATQASPIVITATSHGYATGDDVYISGITGMTEINGKSFKITVLTANTFELQDTDGTGYTAYVSGGIARLTYDSVSGDLTGAGNTNDITWTAVADADKYNIYREVNGIYGYIGSADGLTFSDTNIEPDLSDTPPAFREPFDVGETPTVVEYFEQRLVFAINQTLKMSQTANFHNFSVSTPARDDDAVTATLNASKVNAIRWLVPLNELLAMTSSGTWKVFGPDGFVTPADVNAKRQGSYRVADVRPMVIGTNVVYVSGKTVRDLAYSFDVDAYDGKDISILAKHLFENRTVVNWSFAQEPDNLIWAIMSDGKAVTITYLKEQDIYAFTRHETDGTFEDVCVVPEDDTDAVYFIVNRTIDGQTKRFVERLAERDFTDIEDAYFVDCGLTYDGSPATTISGLWHLAGEEVTVLADGNVIDGLTVSETTGAITLPTAASVVHVGLGYTAKLNTLDVHYELRDGTSQGDFKAISEITLKVRKTRGLKAGPEDDEDRLVEIKQRENENYDTPTEMADGDLQVTVDPDWRTESDLWIVQDYPLPCTILSLTMEVHHGG